MFGGMEIKVLEKVLEKVIKGEDYRSDVISVISANFLEFTIKFFKKIVEAKLKGEEIGVDWYKNYFLNTNLPKEEIAINAGINIKTMQVLILKLSTTFMVQQKRKSLLRLQKKTMSTYWL